MEALNLKHPLSADHKPIPFFAPSVLAGAFLAGAAGFVVAMVLAWHTAAADGTVGCLAGFAVCFLAMAALEARRQQAVRLADRATQTSDLLSQVFESLPIGIQIKDTELRYRWVNDAHARRSGRDTALLIGKRPDEVGMDPDFAAEVIEHDRRVLQSGEIEGPEEQALRTQGGELVQLLLVTKIPLKQHGRVKYIATVDIDLSAAGLAQWQGDEARALLQVVMDAAPITIQVIDRDNRLSWGNQAFRRHFGWSDAPLEGRRLIEVTRSLGSSPATDEANAAIFSGAESRVEIEQYYPASDWRPEVYLLVTKVPICDATGKVVRLLTMGTDITALKRAQIEAETANSLVAGILRHAPISLQVKDADLRIRWTNEAFSSGIGSTVGDLLGKTLREAGLDDDKAARVDRMDREVLDKGAIIQFEDHWEQPSGIHHFMVTKAPLLDRAGRVSHVITIGADISEIYRLRAEADEARHKLQIVLDEVPVSIALKDRDRRYVYVNRAFERVHGDLATRVIGKRVDDFDLDPTLVAQVAASDEALLNGSVDAPEMRQDLVDSKGERRTFSVRRIALRDATGAAEGILAVGADVTELTSVTTELRRLNEELEQRVTERAEELAQVNELVATVIQSAPVPIVIYRPDGSIGLWNPAAERLSGISAGDLAGGQVGDSDLLTNSGFARLVQMNKRGHAFANVELGMRRFDGDSVELLVSGAPLRKPDGTIGGAVNIWLDVTDRKHAAARLAETNDRLKSTNAILAATLEHMSQGVCFFDSNSCLIACNRQYAQLYGLPPEDVRPGMPLQDIQALRYATGFAPEMPISDYIGWREGLRVLAEPSDSQVHLANGRIIFISHHPLPDGGWVATHEDITERRRTEDMLRQAQKLESVGRLTAGVAHDFNNLLQSVVIALEMVATTDDVQDDPMLMGLVQNAMLAVTSGGELTQQLLAFSRKQVLKPAHVDVAELVRSMWGLLRQACAERASVTLPAAGPVFLCLVDISQFKAALLNLVINARDAVGVGGEISIAIETLQIGSGLPSGGDLGPGRYVQVAVTDNGQGISPENLELVFDPFFTTKPFGVGSGLGLAQVHGFAHQSGGSVSIASTLGVGTTVTLLLPLAEVTAEVPVVRVPMS